VAWVDVTLPRSPAPRELTTWIVEPGGKSVSLPRLPKCGFLGGLIHNAFSEILDVWVDIETVKDKSRKHPTPIPPPPIPAGEAGTGVGPTTSLRQTFTTEFEIPFLDWWSTRSGSDEDCVLELSFADPAKVAALSATLNGNPIEVRKYVYSAKTEWHSFYIDLSGHTRPGKQRLAVTVDWKE
jgi:hypothetical protein